MKVHFILLFYLFLFVYLHLALIFCLKWEEGKLRWLIQGLRNQMDQSKAVDKVRGVAGTEKSGLQQESSWSGLLTYWTSLLLSKSHGNCPERARKTQLQIDFSKAGGPQVDQPEGLEKTLIAQSHPQNCRFSRRGDTRKCRFPTRSQVMLLAPEGREKENYFK